MYTGQRLFFAAICVLTTIPLANSTDRSIWGHTATQKPEASLTTSIGQRKQAQNAHNSLLSSKTQSTQAQSVLTASSNGHAARISRRKRTVSATTAAASVQPMFARSLAMPKYNLRTISSGRTPLTKTTAAGGPAFSQKNLTTALMGKNDTVRILSGKLGTSSPVSAQNRAVDFPKTAKNFIAENKHSFGLKDPEKNMRLKRSWTDVSGRSHAVFQRMIEGVPIKHEEVALHGTGSNFYYINARYNNVDIAANTAANLSSKEALQAALSHLSVTQSSLLRESVPELMLLEIQGAYHYVYEVVLLLDNMIRWNFIIDADSGDVLEARQDIHSQLVAASGDDALGVQRNFTAWQQDSTFYLLDPSTPYPDSSYDPLNVINSAGDQILVDAQNADNFDSLFFSQSSELSSGWDPVGVSVFANTRATFDYYLDTHGRNSVDGNGMNLYSVIHYKQNQANAFWNGVYAVYGDGDGRDFSEFGACLDVVAHELTHGVIETSSGLTYSNQSGALNESFADIMGAMVDRDDWLIGEDCVITRPGYLRSLAVPNSGLNFQPDHMNEFQNLPNTAEGDWGGVHINSGIPNRVAYLAAEGFDAEGTGTSIGRFRTERIFYRAFTTYLTSRSEFIDARFATLQAATDLYGASSQELDTITDAWNAVGVTGESSYSPGTPIDSTVGDDYMVYLYPVDGISDDLLLDNFDLYRQAIPEPFPGYDADLDLGPLNIAQFSSAVTPAPLTVDGQLFIFYVGSDGNVYLVFPDGSEEVFLEDAGAYAFAISPDQRYMAVISSDLYDSNIYVFDFDTEQWSANPIESPNYSDNGTVASTALFADSLAFDYTGRTLIYDYLTCLPSPGEQCDPLTSLGYWSIATLDVTSGRFAFPFPVQSPDIDLGYPKFANRTNRYFVFDYNDWSEYDSTGLVKSSIFIFDTVDQDLQLVGLSTIEDLPFSSWGTPSFSGNDEHVIFQLRDESSTVAMRSSLIDYTWGESVELLNDFSVAFPVAHRNATRVVEAVLELDKAELDFGSVAAGQSASRSFNLSNTGNRDIEISSVSNARDVFTHDLGNRTLSVGDSAKVQVTFTALGVNGRISDQLLVGHTGDNVGLVIDMSAVISGSDTVVVALKEDVQALARLYSAAFDRAPKTEGLNFWVTSYERGRTIESIAGSFYTSPEFTEKYGPLGDIEFVERLFMNVLGRAGNTGGVEFWSGHLETGRMTRAEVLASFADSPENRVKTGPIFDSMRKGSDGTWSY